MEVKHLDFSYDKNKREKVKILKDVNLKIEDKKVTTLIGANGCGKSTLFNLMTKNLVPDQGEIYLDGKNISEIKQRDFAKRVAIVHQNNTAANDITVEKLVNYGRTPYLGFFSGKKEEDREAVEWALQVTNLNDYRERRVMSLSGGQRQRAWIAMALAQKTEILFLDEPTTYLDIRYQIELLEMIRDLNRKYQITIIMVLHDMNHAVYYSDEIIGLKNGSVYIQGKSKNVITSDTIQEIYGIRLDVSERNGRKIVMTVR